jgi:TolB-like protein/Flp pilus assembly protein TadD
VEQFTFRRVLRFGDVELDMQGYELKRKGRPIRLERQPMDLLLLLVERRPALVTREEIITRLWDHDTFVDVEIGIHTAIRKIRRALSDSPGKRRSDALIETVSGKGYRFVADVVTAEVNPPVMLAVLPFVNLTGDAERDYLADGVTEDAIAALSQIDPAHLRVIGRTSAMAYKGSSKSLAQIGAELGAQFIVEGSMRIDGPILRTRWNLNRVADQAQVWSATYDRDIAGLASLAHDLAAPLARHINPGLAREQAPSAARRQSDDAAAYDLYLRGRRFWNQLTATTTRKAIEYYTRATDLDPRYALAWAGLAEAFASAPINADAEPLVMWPRAREVAEQAVAANSQLSEANTVSGQINWFFEWDWPRALECHRRAIALDPSNAWSHSVLGHILSQLGRHEEGKPYMHEACRLEPMSALQYAMASQVWFQARDFEGARQRARRAIAIDPEFWVGHMMLGQACEQLAETEVALDALATAIRLSDGNSKPVGLRGYVLATRGQTAGARDVLQMLTDLGGLRYVPPFAMALVHVGLGEDERVFEWLHRAYTVRDVHLMFLTADPKWDRYRERPEFISLLAKYLRHRESDGETAAPSGVPPTRI